MLTMAVLPAQIDDDDVDDVLCAGVPELLSPDGCAEELELIS